MDKVNNFQILQSVGGGLVALKFLGHLKGH